MHLDRYDRGRRQNTSFADWVGAQELGINKRRMLAEERQEGGIELSLHSLKVEGEEKVDDALSGNGNEVCAPWSTFPWSSPLLLLHFLAVSFAR